MGITIDGQKIDLCIRQLGNAIAHGWVLDRSRNHAVGGAQTVQALDGDVVSFGAGRGEDDLDRLAAKNFRDFLAGVVKHGASLSARGILRAGVYRARGGNPRIDGHLAHRLSSRIVKVVRHYLRDSSSATKAGEISWTSPTTPRSAIWKKGSS